MHTPVLVPARVAKAAADQAARLELERIQAGVQQQQLATCRKDLAPLPQVLSEFRLVRNKRIATATGASTEYSSKASIKVGKTLAEHARACAELCRAARTCAGFDEIGDDISEDIENAETVLEKSNQWAERADALLVAIEKNTHK